jgi:anthranilate/para-aminobenzoate synthase component I
MYYPSKQEFLRLTHKGNLVPVYKEILADVDTPVSAYFKVAANARYSFLLESVEGEEKIARYSFLASDPEMVIRCKDGELKVSHLKNGIKRTASRRVAGTCFLIGYLHFISDPGRNSASQVKISRVRSLL